MLSAIKLVFSNYRYIVLSGIIFAAMFIPLSILSEYIFLEPYVVMYVTYDDVFRFSLVVIVSILSGLVLSMNVYRIKSLRNSRKKMSGGVLGSILGASAGACGCGPIGFAIISTLGSIGGVATAFLTNYEFPIRIASIGILILVYYTTSKSILTECIIQKQNSTRS
ncbi:MAG: hypothetical protein IIA81_04980 [Thaumarchaeota archaeon]|nr:hypothetical protein [Nitrososphaerota archaeon]